MTPGDLTKKALTIVTSSGEPALSQACRKILSSQYDNGKVQEALHFYAKSVLPKVLPIFPALLALSSKAAGGKERNVEAIAAAMVLITASGDIHDDIIDKSASKFGNKTLFGKYGPGLALLAGDLLLTQGLTELQKECARLSKERQSTIMSLVFEGMIGIVRAEALEPKLWLKKNATPKDLFEVIQLKGGVAELHCRLGGIIVSADKESVDSLGSYGRVVGILSTLKEEFVDLSNAAELKHRLKCELPPYPMLCAVQNGSVKTKVDAATKKAQFSSKGFAEIEKIVLGSAEVKKIFSESRELGAKELACNPMLTNNSNEELAILLKALSVELPLV